MYILGIESSCDECACAILDENNNILSSKIATQIAQHTEFNGVVPELASRLHTELVHPVVDTVIKESGIKKTQISTVAVTEKPGLLGSLIVGVNFARGFSSSLSLPIIGIDHILAHIYASQIYKKLEYPYISLLVSGGHTLVCVVKNYDDLEILGATVDDAVGEAYDKVAKAYNFGYPGGVYIDKLSKQGDPLSYAFPYPRLKNPVRPLDLSFSGLKNAVINQSEHFRKGEKKSENIAASFQYVAINYLVKKVQKAVEITGIKRVSIGGGVAANSYLREKIQGLEKKGCEVVLPPLSLCTDNAVMVAGLGAQMFKDKKYILNSKVSAKSRENQYKGYM